MSLFGWVCRRLFSFPVTHRHKKEELLWMVIVVSLHELNNKKNNKSMHVRQGEYQSLPFFFPRGRCHRLTVWVMNLRLRDQINPGCRSPCRTPTGWCRSEAGHANPGWSKSILVCPGWLAIMHLYLYMWHIITVVACSFFCWHTSDLWMYISHFPRFSEFWCPVHICQFTERFFVVFSISCVWFPRVKLTNIDKLRLIWRLLQCALGVWYYAIISRISGPSDGAGEGERYTEGMADKTPPWFFVVFEVTKLVCWFCLLCKRSDGRIWLRVRCLLNMFCLYRSDSHIFAWQSALKTIAFLEKLQVSLLGIWNIKPPATWRFFLAHGPWRRTCPLQNSLRGSWRLDVFFCGFCWVIS